MHIYKTTTGIVIRHHEKYFSTTGSWDELINTDELFQRISKQLPGMAETSRPQPGNILPPIQSQEVWAAGVTYLRSRNARMEESKNSGGDTFYDKVYDAQRPELFFKSMPHKVAGSGQSIRIRKDSDWNVPEPELTLLISPGGRIIGYTIGNDVSSRSIEGENPLYLPQAKCYDGAAALGPCLYVPETEIDPQTLISMQILRSGRIVYNDQVSISQMKRSHTELVKYLYLENTFKQGCFLMTGTCLVPEHPFTLQSGDEIRITIDPIGTLQNTVE